jgi:hypothetical protein
MSGIKFGRGDENLRLDILNHFTKYWVVAYILDLLVYKKYAGTLL